MSFRKNFRFGGRYNLTPIFDVFNLFNTVNLGQPERRRQQRRVRHDQRRPAAAAVPVRRSASISSRARGRLRVTTAAIRHGSPAVSAEAASDQGSASDRPDVPRSAFGGYDRRRAPRPQRRSRRSCRRHAVLERAAAPLPRARHRTGLPQRVRTADRHGPVGAVDRQARERDHAGAVCALPRCRCARGGRPRRRRADHPRHRLLPRQDQGHRRRCRSGWCRTTAARCRPTWTR